MCIKQGLVNYACVVEVWLKIALLKGSGMPGYKGHVCGGIASYGVLVGALALFFSLDAFAVYQVEWFLCAVAGSLFPDIDTKSKGQRIFYFLAVITLGVLLARAFYKTAFCFGFLTCMPLVSAHRGIFHRLPFLLCLVLILAYGAWMVYPQQGLRIYFAASFFFAGIISHLLLDFGLKRVLSFK